MNLLVLLEPEGTGTHDEHSRQCCGFEIKQWWVQHLEHMQSTCNGTRSTAWDKHRICRRPLARNTICTSAIIHLYYLTD